MNYVFNSLPYYACVKEVSGKCTPVNMYEKTQSTHKGF